MIDLKKISFFDRSSFEWGLCAYELSGNYPKHEVISYLASGIEIFSWLEAVNCLYDCGGKNLGAIEITDGMWVWDKALVHYVSCHCVELPKEFLLFLEGRSYKFIDGKQSIKIRSLISDPTTLESEIRYLQCNCNALVEQRKGGVDSGAFHVRILRVRKKNYPS